MRVSSDPLIFIEIPESSLPVFLYLGVTDKIITVDKERIPGCHRWLPTTPTTQGSPFTFEPDLTLATKK